MPGNLLINASRRLVLLLALMAPGGAAVLAAEPASEQAVRAALVFNFIKFTEWPPATNGDNPLRICAATGDPVQVAALEALGERQVRGLPLVISRFRQQINCDVIYVDSSQRWSEVPDKRILGRALTIGGYPGFAAEGGIIEVSMPEGQVRFDINLAEAKRAGLRFYPQLLRLARRILE